MSPSVSIRPDVGGAPYDWALDQLRQALGARLRPAHERTDVIIHVHRPGDTTASVAIPSMPDSFCLVPEDGLLSVCASTPRGLAYAMLDLAERLREPGSGLWPMTSRVVEQPVGRVRSVARFFNSIEEDRLWFHDEQGWCDYLTMLASNRLAASR